MRRILLIEDEPILKELMSYLLNELGCSVLYASNRQELDLVCEEPFDAAVVDLSVLKPSPEETLLRLKDNPEHPQLILCSASAQLNDLAHQLGCRSLAKPFGIDDFSEMVEEALADHDRVQSPLLGWQPCPGLGRI